MSKSVFLTVPEAAARSRLSVRTIRRAIIASQLQAVHPGGRRRVLSPGEALEAFMYCLADARESPPVEPDPSRKAQ
jgi:excisionase family DNA binding protein